MKSILIVYNQALTERVESLLDKLNIRGYTRFDDVKGRGSKTGEPHMGTHTWPAINSATICVVENEMVGKILQEVRKLEQKTEMQGIRAFSWNIEELV
jgi:nitrogen regulatory protein PII